MIHPTSREPCTASPCTGSAVQSTCPVSPRLLPSPRTEMLTQDQTPGQGPRHGIESPGQPRLPVQASQTRRPWPLFWSSSSCSSSADCSHGEPSWSSPEKATHVTPRGQSGADFKVHGGWGSAQTTPPASRYRPHSERPSVSCSASPAPQPSPFDPSMSIPTISYNLDDFREPAQPHTHVTKGGCTSAGHVAQGPSALTSQQISHNVGLGSKSGPWPSVGAPPGMHPSHTSSAICHDLDQERGFERGQAHEGARGLVQSTSTASGGPRGASLIPGPAVPGPRRQQEGTAVRERAPYNGPSRIPSLPALRGADTKATLPNMYRTQTAQQLTQAGLTGVAAAMPTPQQDSSSPSHGATWRIQAEGKPRLLSASLLPGRDAKTLLSTASVHQELNPLYERSPQGSGAYPDGSPATPSPAGRAGGPYGRGSGAVHNIGKLNPLYSEGKSVP